MKLTVAEWNREVGRCRKLTVAEWNREVDHCRKHAVATVKLQNQDYGCDSDLIGIGNYVKMGI